MSVSLFNSSHALRLLEELCAMTVSADSFLLAHTCNQNGLSATGNSDSIVPVHASPSNLSANSFPLDVHVFELVRDLTETIRATVEMGRGLVGVCAEFAQRVEILEEERSMQVCASC